MTIKPGDQLWYGNLYQDRCVPVIVESVGRKWVRLKDCWPTIKVEIAAMEVHESAVWTLDKLYPSQEAWKDAFVTGARRQANDAAWWTFRLKVLTLPSPGGSLDAAAIRAAAAELGIDLGDAT